MRSLRVIGENEVGEWGARPRKAMHAAHKGRQRQLRAAPPLKLTIVPPAPASEDPISWVNRVEATAEMARSAPQLPSVSGVVRGYVDYLGDDCFVFDIQTITANYFSLDREAIVSRSTRRRVALARNIAAYLSRELTDYPLEILGRIFGKRDHTTILYNHRVIRRRLKTDPELQRQINEIKQRVILSSWAH